jgi:6-phosphogluconolactonase/glucosamine-6-phosphate isomerase/deaminase
MKLVILEDADSIALAAAKIIAADAREAFAARGRFALAVSGGHTPWIMLRALAILDSPPVLDLAHLGLGPDGHTASLVPGDAALDVTDEDVALTALYAGRRRMTLTFPALNRARRVLWVVTGNEKVQMLRRLLDSDASIPAGRVHREHALLLADRAATTAATN